MFRPFETFVGSRYLRSRNRNRFVSFISFISVIGIAVSVAILIVVLSVMNGFESEVRGRILSVLSHGSITGMDGRMDDWQVVAELAADNPAVTGQAPFISGQAMLVGTAGAAGIELRGVEPEAEKTTSGAADMVVDGSFNTLTARGWNIVLGQALAERLGVTVGETVVLMSPEGGVTPAGVLPRMRRFTVSGIFYAGMYEYDRSLAYVHLRDAAGILRFGDAVSGLSLAVSNPLTAQDTVREVALAYGGGVYISDWTRQHANFFRSIQLTKSIIFVILLMVVAVAAFNIVSTLIMVVRDKHAEIAIMRSMGASARSVLAMFITQGVLIGLTGTLLGTTFGVVLALNIGTLVGWVESLLQMQFVAPDVYFISELPSRILWQDVAQVSGLAFALVVVATVYPALRGAATNPAQALRHD